MTLPNTNPGYWYGRDTTQSLAFLAEIPAELVSGELALIAGDSSDMSDFDVIETFCNENDVTLEELRKELG